MTCHCQYDHRSQPAKESKRLLIEGSCKSDFQSFWESWTGLPYWWVERSFPTASGRHQGKKKPAWKAHSSFLPLSIMRTCPRNTFKTSAFGPGLQWHYMLKREIFLHFYSVPVWCSSNLIWPSRLTLCEGDGLGKKWDSQKEKLIPAKNKMSSVQVSWPMPRDLTEDHQCI